MKLHHSILLAALLLLMAATGAGLFLTSHYGNRTVSVARNTPGQDQPAVDMQQMQTAMALAPLAATSEEQDRASDALRLADHEVDFAFAAALYRATSQTAPSTPEIRSIVQRISQAQKSVDEMNAEVERLTKLQSAASGKRKQALAQQLDLANARLELNQDELADANQDLERAGGDPKSRIQRMVDEHKASAQDSNGHLNLGAVGSQSASTLPASGSFLPRARAWIAVRAFQKRLKLAEQEASAKAATFSNSHDDLERQLDQAKSEQSKKLAGAPSVTPDQTDAAISSYRSLTVLQKTVAALDDRIRNEQDLSVDYAQWGALTVSRGRALLLSLFVSFAWMLLVGVVVLIVDRLTERIFDRIEPDRRHLLTLREVAHIITRAIGAIVILLIVLGLPSQTATILAFAGAGLTVALKDFIVGFFGWFMLMGKNGIRHGDWVEINGVSGEVVEIGLFHTVLLETGNWNDSGHPTGRRVTFVNSYAIEGHYFNFSTSGQWLWDELQITVPLDQDPYPIAEEIQKIVTGETEANSRLAEQEWADLGDIRRTSAFSAGPAINVRPSNLGFDILVRYVTRANERHRQRSKLYHDIVEVLRQKNIHTPEAAPLASSAAAESA